MTRRRVAGRNRQYVAHVVLDRRELDYVRILAG